MNPVVTEWLANVLNVATVILILYNSPWNWPLGIANCVLYMAVFIPAKLYGDTSLQVVYIVLSLYGLYEWLFGKGGVKANMAGVDTELPITATTQKEGLRYVALGIILSVGLVAFLARFTNTDEPIWDGLLTALCLTATVMMAYRKIGHWWLWIASDVFYFALYYHKQLVITMWFQIPLLVCSIFGFLRWQREMRFQNKVTHV